MVKANELRIGNLIQDIQYKSPWRIEAFYGNQNVLVDAGGVNFPTDDQHEPELNDMEPIPLTEEWLIKLGFKTEFYGGQGNVGTTATTDTGINKHYPILFEIYNYAGTDYWLFENGLKWRLEIKHVHQLQNLYFALTGEELEIK